MIKPFDENLLENLLDWGVLRFGSFKTKAGRLSPYFFNTGEISTATRIDLICEKLADLCQNKCGHDVNLLVGPAYKGIPLAVMTAKHLAAKYGQDVAFCYNRKEVKDHGEGGIWVGHAPLATDKTVIVEDILSAGTSLRESIQLLQSVKAPKVQHAVVIIDRQELGTKNLSAKEEIKNDYGVEVHALLQLNDIVERLSKGPLGRHPALDAQTQAAIKKYVDQYGRI